MKKSIYLIIGFMMLLMMTQFSNGSEIKSDASPQTTITVACSPDLNKLTSNWAEEYSRLNPEVQVIVVDIRDKQLTNSLIDGSMMAIVSKNNYQSKNLKSLRVIEVGRDVIVPVMNSDNPLSKQILQQGISSDQLARILKNKKNLNWNELFGEGNDAPIHYYMINDEATNSAISDFLKTNVASRNGTILANSEEMIAAVQSDPFAIGFLRLTDILNPKNQSLPENIALLPIDKNGNGQLDSFEKIYNDLNTFSRGVWIGKYPSELVSNLYTLSSEKSGIEENDFLKWVLTDGQQFLYANGFSSLVSAERQSKLDKLNGNQAIPNATNENYAGWKIAIMVLMLSIVAALILETIILFFKYRFAKYTDEPADESAVFNVNAVNAPKGLFFDKTHTWVYMEKEGVVKIGVDDFLPRVTGQLTGIKMKNPGERIKKGEIIITLIQNGKQLNIKAPVSGTIKEQNKGLLENISLINFSPYSEGWIYQIEPANWLREIQFLFMAEKFRSWMKTELARLKDFFALYNNSNDLKYAQLILQEGGELKEGVLKDLGPEIWEDFQSHFIETSI